VGAKPLSKVAIKSKNSGAVSVNDDSFIICNLSSKNDGLDRRVEASESRGREVPKCKF
jgi:hypothetical protein